MTREQLTQEKVLEELISIGFSNLDDYLDVTGEYPVIRLQNTTREKLRALSAIETQTTVSANGEVTTRVKIKLWDKRAALVDLGKHTGLWEDKQAANLTFIQIVENMLKLPAPPLDPGQWTPERWRREQQGEVDEQR